VVDSLTCKSSVLTSTPPGQTRKQWDNMRGHYRAVSGGSGADGRCGFARWRWRATADYVLRLTRRVVDVERTVCNIAIHTVHTSLMSLQLRRFCWEIKSRKYRSTHRRLRIRGKVCYLRLPRCCCCCCCKERIGYFSV